MSFTDFRMDPDPKMEPSNLTAKEDFTGDDTTEFNHRHYDKASDKLSTGTWECAPCHEVIDAYPVHEMMTVVSGEITLTHKDGRSEKFGPGDTFFIAKGQYVDWRITKTLRKIYMIVE